MRRFISEGRKRGRGRGADLDCWDADSGTNKHDAAKPKVELGCSEEIQEREGPSKKGSRCFYEQNLKSGLISALSCEYSVPTSPQWILTRLSNSTLHGISSTAYTGHIRLRPPLIRHQLPALLLSSTHTPCLPPTFLRSPPASVLPVSPAVSRATRNPPPTAVALRRRTRSVTRLSLLPFPSSLQRCPIPAPIRRTVRIPAPPSPSTTTPTGHANDQTACTTNVVIPLHPVPHPTNPTRPSPVNL